MPCSTAGCELRRSVVVVVSHVTLPVEAGEKAHEPPWRRVASMRGTTVTPRV